MTGIERIKRAFAPGPSAIMPYFTLGFPTPKLSLQIVAACAEAGADIMELGVPFSDPLADGPTIQYSSHEALSRGMTVRGCLENVGQLRSMGVATPFVLMAYYNSILNAGIPGFVQEAAQYGVDGFIVPDLPPEEAKPLDEACMELGLARVYLVTPNTPSSRVAAICAVSSGFTYLVSVTGTTGERSDLPQGLTEFVARVRAYAKGPIAVGFGISSEDHVHQVSRIADGVVVGSALIMAARNAISHGDDPVRAVGDRVRKLRAAIC